jgi:hypothetical protein
LFLLLLVSNHKILLSQADTTKITTRFTADTSAHKLNMDAVYNRPFLLIEKTPIAIGGYAEANTQYSQTDGLTDGFSFQMRRMTIFLSSTITEKIKFLSEIEFEDGTKEINLEYAAIDVEFDPLLNLRGGIIINPIGSFNQNHDGPRWDFINRPISSTTILPATLSNVGFGMYGKYFYHSWVVGYETYLSNGFDDKIISNEENRTSLAAGSLSPKKFEESNSGLLMFTGKFAIRNRKIGEIGISYMTGVYNKWRVEGVIIDKKRTADVIAVDCNTSLFDNRLNITAEAAKILVDVPDTYSQTFGSRQFGGFIDIVGTVLQEKMFDWENAKINLGVRLQYADYNQGIFKETNGNISDDLWAIVGSIAFRPVETTVIRFNYNYQQQKDLLGNQLAKTGTVQFGFSTYF